MAIDKSLEWVGSTLKDLTAFPDDVKTVVGYAIRLAQQGSEHPSAKALKGFGGRGVLEVVEDYDGDTYRAVYTVKFAGVIYALHAFQKKAKKGIATPQKEIDLVKERLSRAEEHYKVTHGKGARK